MTTIVGTFFVRPSATYKAGWRLIRQFFENGKQRDKTVPKLALHALGFTPQMSVEDARARARQLNAENSVKRLEQQRLARTAERVVSDSVFHAAFLPEHYNQGFLEWLEGNVAPKQVTKNKITWGTVKKMLINLKLVPQSYAENQKLVFRYLANQEYSLPYVKKIIWLANAYGKYASKVEGRFFEKIPPPKGHNREMINDAYFDSDSYLGASEALTPDILLNIQSHVKDIHYEWLFITVWLGLRPSELDLILSDRDTRYWRVDQGETSVLWVYQPKLTSKPRAKRWKPIPLIYPEQQEALALIYKGGAAKPLTKTLKKYTGLNVTLYGGRKGFTDLMLGRGQRLEDIAQWLGHASIQMTWAKYKDQQNVSWTAKQG